jgi:hypothetical protein
MAETSQKSGMTEFGRVRCRETDRVRRHAATGNTGGDGVRFGAVGSGGRLGCPPEYEQAYVNGQTVTINAIEVHQSKGALEHAAADFYQVVYPTDHSLWPAPPQCNPCDHQGNGIDFTDFHDHVLDSVPGTGHGEFNPLWHVFLIVPENNDPATQAAYAAHLPLKSEAAVDALVASPLAAEIDTNFYFLCSV